MKIPSIRFLNNQKPVTNPLYNERECVRRLSERDKNDAEAAEMISLNVQNPKADVWLVNSRKQET